MNPYSSPQSRRKTEGVGGEEARQEDRGRREGGARPVKDEVEAQQTEGGKGAGGAVVVDLMLAKTKAPEKLADGEFLRAPATRKSGA